MSSYTPRQQRVFFTADTHLGHDRIIEYCKRPFASHEEMEEVMLERFNRLLRKGDLLYHLGDVAWSAYDLGRFFGRLNTRNCQLILGNHDGRKHTEYERWFNWVGECKRISVSGTSAMLYHYPMRSWAQKGRGGFQLYGHCHGSLEPGLDRSMDVGVDTHDFTPYSWDEVYETLITRPQYSDTTKSEGEGRMTQAIQRAIERGDHVRDDANDQTRSEDPSAPAVNTSL